MHERYVARNGVGEWWVMEHDPSTQNAFGFAEISDREAGYFDLAALESLRIVRTDGRVILVERDLDWTPRPWSEVDHD